MGPLPTGSPDAATLIAESPDAHPNDGGSFRPGQHIAGRYIISSLLGKGGVGMVYKAMDTTLGEEIAIKVLQVQTHRDPRDVERFKREILTARRITHPNVIRIHDFGTVGGEAFISMQLLTGGTLAEKIENGALPVREAVNIAIGICEGLEAAHQEGIVHRDIKPDNVLFDGNGRPKLVDFGLARLANATTRTVGFSGTPFYMSPEQAEGTEATPTSDVYSLGVLLYELFVGKLPFLADSLVRLVVLHTRELPPAPRSIRPDLPEDIEAIILQALEKDPNRRQGSAAEVAEQFKAWRSGLHVPRPPRDDDKTDNRIVSPGFAGGAAPRRADAPTRVPSPLRGGTAADRIAQHDATRIADAPAEGAGSKRVLLAAGGGLLALVVLLGGFVAAGGLENGETTVATPAPTPFAAGADPPATSISTATSISNVAPTVAPTVVPTAVARATAVVRQTPRPAQTPNRTPIPQPTKVAAVGKAMLKVGGDRGVWVKVSVDGKELRGESPIPDTPIDSGEHVFRFRNPAMNIDISKQATVAPGGTVEFKITEGQNGKFTAVRLQ